MSRKFHCKCSLESWWVRKGSQDKQRERRKNSRIRAGNCNQNKGLFLSISLALSALLRTTSCCLLHLCTWRALLLHPALAPASQSQSHPLISLLQPCNSSWFYVTLHESSVPQLLAVCRNASVVQARTLVFLASVKLRNRKWWLCVPVMSFDLFSHWGRRGRINTCSIYF